MRSNNVTASYRFLLSLGSLLILGGVLTTLAKNTCVHALTSCNTSENVALSQTTEELAPGYVVYSPQTLKKAKENGKTVLYFWAPWCATCTSLDLELQQKGKTVPEGITVLRVEYDKAPELRQKYHVTTQHTFVQIDENDEQLAFWIGGEIEKLQENVK